MNLIRKNFFPNNLLRNSLPLLSLFYAPKKRTMLCLSIISVLFWFPSPYIYARAHSHASLCFSFPFLFHFNFPLTLSLNSSISLRSHLPLSLSQDFFDLEAVFGDRSKAQRLIRHQLKLFNLQVNIFFDYLLFCSYV